MKYYGSIDANLKIDSLANIDNLNIEQLEKLQDLIEYNKNYSSKSKEEQEVIDTLMDYLKIGVLKRQVRPLWKKKPSIIRKEKEKRILIGNLTKTLEDHGMVFWDRENSIYARLNQFRKSIKLPEIDIASRIGKRPKRPNPDNRDEHTYR